MMVSRFGLDLDGHDGLRVLCAALNARKYGDVATYYTRHGFHVEVDLEDEIDLEAAMVLRRCLGDDPRRLEFDERKLEVGWEGNVDTLFEFKQYPDGSTYRRWPFDVVRKK